LRRLTVLTFFSLRISFAKLPEHFLLPLVLDYIIFDFGRRLQEVAISRSNLLGANFLFNDTHRKVTFQVMEAYYRVLNSKGQEESESYDAALQSYNYGVRSQIDVVSAQRVLAVARTADVSARTQLLTGIAALVFQTGDLLHYAKRP
jgi:outer membrane protein